MKTEPCPICKQTPKFTNSQYSDVLKRTDVKCGCGRYGEWGGEWKARFWWNVEARSYARQTKRAERRKAKQNEREAK